MTAIQLLACAGMIVGVFLLLEMKPVINFGVWLRVARLMGFQSELWQRLRT